MRGWDLGCVDAIWDWGSAEDFEKVWEARRFRSEVFRKDSSDWVRVVTFGKGSIWPDQHYIPESNQLLPQVVLPESLLDEQTVYHINPSGIFVIGGPCVS